MSPSLAQAARPRRFADRGGFTLVEVLVAFTVMAILLSVVFRGVVAMRAGSIAFEQHSHLEFGALDELEDALSHRELRTGTFSGHRAGRRWTLVMEPIDLAGQLPQPTEMPKPDRKAQPSQYLSTSQGVAVPPVDPMPAEKPAWTTQRLKVRVESIGRPIEIETIRLVRAK